MVNAIPPLVSNRGSLPEICGDAALYVDSFDREALARSIAAVLTDPALASNLIARGKRRAAQFTWDRAAKQTLALLRSIAGNMAAARTGSILGAEAGSSLQDSRQSDAGVARPGRYGAAASGPRVRHDLRLSRHAPAMASIGQGIKMSSGPGQRWPGRRSTPKEHPWHP